MSTITTRAGKGSPLTNSEVDSNFTNLNADKYQSGDDAVFASVQLTGGTGDQGKVTWNTDEETLDVILNGSTLQVGQEIHVHVRNSTGSTIPNGTVVYASGTLGASGRILVTPFIANGTIPAKRIIGVTTEDIANEDDGKVATFGKIRNLDTSAYTDGAILYASAATAGALTATEPASPNLSLPIAFVIHAASNGTLFTRLTTLDENAFATYTQGQTADSAVQPGDNVSALTNDAGYATTGYVDTAEADAVATAAADATTKANAAESNAIATAAADATTKANAAESNAIATAAADATTKANAAEADAIATAAADATTKANAAEADAIATAAADATTKANAAEADAIATAAADATTKANAAESNAIATAAADATTKANAAESNANSYTDTAVANIVDTAPATLDTLNELAAALGDDPSFATTVSGQIGTAQSTADTALTNANAALAKDPTLTLSGDASGSATFTNLGNATLSVTVADDSHNHVIANVDGLQTALNGKQATGDYIVASGDSMTGNLNFGDNDKAVFGAGSDLQIYHNGADSIIKDVGSGGLSLQSNGTAVTIYDNANSKIMAQFVTGGESKLNYNGSQKLATKSTGVDVTGNITVSGTVDGRDVAADGSKLDGIATNANNYSHPTYAGDDFSIDTGALSGATVISDIDINVTTDTLGHVTDANATVATRNLTLANLGFTGATNANYYTHPSYLGDDINLDTGALSGATVISDLDFNVTTDTLGHVTDANATYSTRNLTAANIGAQPAGTYNTVIGTDSDINTSGATIIDNLYMTDGVITSHGTRTLTLSDLGYTPPTSFASGTLMLFQQTSAPTGWTKQTTHNDKALRVVSGTVSSGGTTAMSTAFGTPSVSGTVGISGAPAAGNLAVSMSGSVSVGNTTLSVNTIPSHSHQYRQVGGTNYYGNPYGNGDSCNTMRNNGVTGNTGNNGAHGHSASHNLSGVVNGAPSVGNLAGSLSSATAAINVQYVDLIIASKD